MAAAEPEPVLLTPETLAAYVVARGVFDDARGIDVRPMGGGVSNIVLAARQGDRRVVVKQALPRLRVEDAWFAKRERAINEAAALRLAGSISPRSVPSLLDVDADACALTIAAAPEGWGNWKQRLLDDDVDPQVAARLGTLLAGWHTATAHDREVAAAFGDLEAFEQLRIEPYHRTIMDRQPGISSAVETYVRELQENRTCLVHGDYSPKNVLVGDGLWVIDFEVAHYGNPVFDVAFMLNHLLLKRLHCPQAAGELDLCVEKFWSSYARTSAVCPSVASTLGHLGCLMIARVDGKSPAEYLTESERPAARSIGTHLLLDPPREIADVLPLVERERAKLLPTSSGEPG
jgi:tRNA A-37 threonylcarbamoyl transferase component Bud32